MAAVEATSVNQNECDDVRIDVVKNGGAMKHSSRVAHAKGRSISSLTDLAAQSTPFGAAYHPYMTRPTL